MSWPVRLVGQVRRRFPHVELSRTVRYEIMGLKSVNSNYNSAGRTSAQECAGVSIFNLPCAHAPVVSNDLVQQPICFLLRLDFRYWE